MQCPVCQNAQLVMSERQGIEIDYCPQCRGVWLDRGELDKIIDRSSGPAAAAPAPAAAVPPQAVPQQHAQPQHAQPPYPQQPYPQQPYPPQHGYRDDRSGHYRKKKREGFLSDLFDFD